MLNKRGFIYWIIIILVILLLSGVVYLKISNSGVEIGSKTSNESINLKYNGSIETTNNNNQSNSTNSSVSLDNISIVGR